MTSKQLALLRRELWEHRAIYVAPLVIALIVSVMSITGQVVVSAFDHVVDMAIIGATNIGEKERSSALTVLLTGISSMFVLTMWLVIIFYCLDCLYAERKDKSILFWRSIPVTDGETVVSKLLTALFVIPAVSFLTLVATHLIVLAISSIWLEIRGGDAFHLIWRTAPLFDNWMATLAFVLAIPLWLSPFVGWFLLVSAYTKRSPLLAAFLPIVLLPMFERILIGTRFLADAFFVRSGKIPLFGDFDTAGLVKDDARELHELGRAGISLLSIVDIPAFLASPALWAGIIVCGLLTTAAIYVRRYRDDS